MIVVLTVLEKALCEPSLAYAEMAKYHVPGVRFPTTVLVVVGLSMLITSLSDDALVPYSIV